MELAMIALGHSASFDPDAQRIQRAIVTQAARLSARLGGRIDGADTAAR
jgi:hypothetical protein